MMFLSCPRFAGVILTLSALIAAGCGASASTTEGNATGGETAEPLTILVAASTRDAVDEAVQGFRSATGLTVRLAAGPSNALAQQILAGAPADLYLSASEHWADAISQANLAADRKTLLQNRLVLVVPRGNPAGVRSLEDLLSDRVRFVALAGEQVPAGMYAGEALEAAGLMQPLVQQKKIVRGQDVRIALTYVERGEAEAAIVYATDALSSDAVETVATLDVSTHEPIRYPLVLIDRKPARLAARQLYDYLTSDEAAAVFRRHGFEPAPPSTNAAHD